MPGLDANGIDIYYEDHGARQPLVMAHGFNWSMAPWAMMEMTRKG